MQVDEQLMENHLTGATDGLTLARRLLRFIGLWPNEMNDWICIAAILYTALHCYTCLLGMIHAEERSDFIESMIEIVFFAMTLMKMTVHKIHSATLSDFVDQVGENVARRNYRSIEDLLKFLRYNAMSRMYVKVTIPAASFTAGLYYLKPIIAGVVGRTIQGRNSSAVVEKLAFHSFYPFELTRTSTFVGLYLYQAPLVIITIAGYIGTDCLFATITLHLCGQYSVLSYQIRRMFDDTTRFRRYYQSLITKHQRLIGLSKAVDASFRVLLLYQAMLLTFLLCFVWHSMLSANDEEQYVEAATYFLCQNSVVVSLFGYCFIGECFIYESGQVTQALYFSRWYEVPPSHVRNVQICILRSQRPIEISAGRFFVLSFSRFTEIIKLSVAYLSFLRSLTD